MGVVWKRLGETGRNWRMVFKSLQLLEYLIKNGHERVANMARERQFQLKSLESFSFTDDEHRDRGKGIREMAKIVHDLLNDWQKLRDIRQEARKNRKKFQNISQGGFPGGNSNSYGGFEGGSSNKWKDDYGEEKKKKKDKGKKKKRRSKSMKLRVKTT
eukprot:UN33080